MIDRVRVLGYRVRAQQLDRAPGRPLAGTDILDAGVQDTGPDGALWALALRGVDVEDLDEADLSTVWTIRGAPHVYRREDLPGVAAAVEPFSELDAGKRIYDAVKPLKAAGITSLEALDAVAAAMRKIVNRPHAKGTVSTRLAARMDAPYLRFCRSCDATHLYEMPFRLAALRAGLELQPGTSPPVLERIPGFHKAATVPPRLDVIRGYLRLLGPATPKVVAEYLDAPVKDVQARWPADAVEVNVEGERRSILAADADALDDGPGEGTRLLGPYDLFLQARDRRLLVDDAGRAKALWPVLGRPGAILHNGAIVGTWRPRKSGAKLALAVDLWTRATATVRKAVTAEAERLAAFREAQLSQVDM